MLVTFFTAVRAEFGLAGLDQVHRCRPAMGLVVLCWLPSCPTGVDRRTGPPSRQVVPGARCWCAGVAGGVGGGLTGSRHTGGRAAEEVTFAGRLRPTTLTVATGQRLLICGPNGAGKSTLLRILAGDLTPDGGQVTRSGRIGYLPQEVSTATSERTLLAAFAHGRPGQTEEHSASGWPWPSCSASPLTYCCWTSPPTIFRSAWLRSWRPHSRNTRELWWWSVTTAGCVGDGPGRLGRWPDGICGW